MIDYAALTYWLKVIGLALYEATMQPPPSSSPFTGLEYALISLAIAVAGVVGGVVTSLINKRKSRPEIIVLNARAEKSMAEARSLDGSTLGRAYHRIDELHVIIDELRDELVGSERERDLQAIRLKHHENQEKRMLALLKLNDISYGDGDGEGL